MASDLFLNTRSTAAAAAASSDTLECITPDVFVSKVTEGSEHSLLNTLTKSLLTQFKDAATIGQFPDGIVVVKKDDAGNFVSCKLPKAHLPLTAGFFATFLRDQTTFWGVSKVQKDAILEKLRAIANEEEENDSDDFYPGTVEGQAAAGAAARGPEPAKQALSHGAKTKILEEFLQKECEKDAKFWCGSAELMCAVNRYIISSGHLKKDIWNYTAFCKAMQVAGYSLVTPVSGKGYFPGIRLCGQTNILSDPFPEPLLAPPPAPSAAPRGRSAEEGEDDGLEKFMSVLKKQKLENQKTLVQKPVGGLGPKEQAVLDYFESPLFANESDEALRPKFNEIVAIMEAEAC